MRERRPRPDPQCDQTPPSAPTHHNGLPTEGCYTGTQEFRNSPNTPNHNEHTESHRITTTAASAAKSGSSHPPLQARLLARLQTQLASGEPPTLDMGEYILAAYAAFHDDERPDWATGMFDFVRVVKISRDLERLTGQAAFRKVDAVVRDWPQGDDEWLAYFGLDRETARAEFEFAWSRVRCPLGRSPFDEALRLADAKPIRFGDDDVLSERTDPYRRFISLAGWLQVTTGPRPIFLPTRKLGKTFKVAAMSISRYRDNGVRDGFLRQVGESKPAKRSKATEFIFDVRRVPMLRDAAHSVVLALAAQAFGELDE